MRQALVAAVVISVAIPNASSAGTDGQAREPRRAAPIRLACSFNAKMTCRQLASRCSRLGPHPFSAGVTRHQP